MYSILEPEEKAEVKEEAASPRKKVWSAVCLACNLIFAVLYVIYSLQIGIAGFFAFVLEMMFDPSAAMFGELLCMLIPFFSVAAIVCSEIFRKKEWFLPALLVHLVPLGLFGVSWFLL
ncbi:MAG: hypothetical protein E7580_08585 [Ruminococcaceae bacterium]|nr:hypothetical protein [Oscillospiraceae bacterium]